MSLHDLLASAAREYASHIAMIEPDGGRIDYANLWHLSDRVRDRLAAVGVRRGDRVGIYLRKSIDAIASIFGILKAGAAYVPVDPTAPAARNVYIHANCKVSSVIVDRRFEPAYRDEMLKLGSLPPTIVVDGAAGGSGLGAALDALDAMSPTQREPNVECSPADLAYVLYTSGSTGRPKGVMLSHGNALSFINWCSDTFQPLATDVFSSHAPLHFDLSIFDIYVPLKHGATCVLVPEDIGKDPRALSALIAMQRMTVWYSAPSILSLLAQFGRISEHDYSSLRLVLFAGEVFPIIHLRSIKAQVSRPRYFNLYGPTETNVCTYYEIPSSIPENRAIPYPIGRTCSNLQSRVVGLDGKAVPAGVEGELCISGPNVMQGYWDLPDHTARCFLEHAADGRRWYKTGDIVIEDSDGNYRYIGRQDRMVKKRGYRVELGEIEACLYCHAAVREVAVVALPDEAAGVKVKAHLSLREAKRLSTVELKTFCSKRLPVYMVPDLFAFHESLPKTSTDKIDYVSLTKMS